MRRSVLVVVSALLLCASLFGQSVSYSYGATGLGSLSFNGNQYLSSGIIGVNAVNFKGPGESLISGSTAGAVSYDAANARTSLAFNWGSIATAYGVAGNHFTVTITIRNTSSQTLQSISLQPLTLQFPSTPAEFDGRDPIWAMNDGNPTAIRMTAGANAVVLANDDVTQPLLVGFPGPTNQPANTVFPIRTETTGDNLVPSFVPLINRPIAPGASDTWRLSLCFGAASTPTKVLAADIYQSFIKAKPFRLNWPDRRPIGQLVIGTSAAGWPGNPRGWLLDRNIDVTTPQGVTAFQTRLLKWASDAVTVLKSMNAQGMLTWDIEGEEYPHATTYIGDPTQIASLAPEMAGVVDRFFKTFTDAGLRVGVCLRPQQFVFPAGGGAPSQVTVADPTQLLLTKLEYARNRWGATLFYVDSNGDPNYPMSPKFFETVAALHPEVLLITEHQSDAYYAFSTPYDELKGGVSATPPAVLDVYPSAASVIYVPDGPIAQNLGALRAAVVRGDILMFRGWYPDPQNQQILGLYPPNGTAPPVPVITSPSNGQRLLGSVNITASAGGLNGVAGLQYVLDGDNLGPLLSAPPYLYNLDSSRLSPGQHTIGAVARDSAGDTGFTMINVSVDATAAPLPVVVITAPARGAVLSGKVVFAATSSAANPLTSAQLFVDGAAVAMFGGPPYQYLWDTGTAANGTHTVRLVVTDATGATGESVISVSVSNLPTAPVLSFTAPLHASTVAGVTTISVNPSGTGVLSVQLSADGRLLATLTSPPYTLSWNSASVANGSHVLNAVVTDPAGSTGTAMVTVNVRNQSPPPSVSFVAPADGATVSGKTTVSARASGVNAISSVQFRVNGTSAATMSSAPFQFLWDTASTPNGKQTLNVIATDSEGNTAQATIAVNVVNAPPAPSVSFLAPLDGAVVAGQSALTVSARGTGSLAVRFSVDGNSLASLSTAPFSLNWNTLQSANGAHILSATVTDSAGATGVSTVTVTVQNQLVPDTAPPSIQLTAPQNNSTLTGVTDVSVVATDNIGVARVVFTVDGVWIGEKTTPPYAIALDSTGLTGGLHYISAKAFDAAGNQASNTNSFSVSNSQPPACGTVGIRALAACFYSDASLSTPVASRLDPELNFDWGTGSPAPGVPAALFSATWLGKFSFEGGTYLLNVVANGGYRVYVDGVAIQDYWTQKTFSNRQIPAAVSPGSHSIMVQYHNGDGNEMKVFWSRQ